MKQKKKKRKTNRLFVILLLLASVCIIYMITPNYKKIQQKELLVFYNNEDKTGQIQQKEKMEEGLYFTLQDMQTLLEKEMYIDETNQWIVMMANTKVGAMNIENPLMEVNSVEIPMEQKVISEAGQYYIPILELEKIYNLDIQYIEETNRLIIDWKNNELISADVKSKVNIKETTNNLSRTLATLKKGESVIWIANEEEWAKVRTRNGMLGYLKQNKLTNFYTVREDMQWEPVEENAEGKVVKLTDLKKVKAVTLQDIKEYETRQKTIEKIVDQCVLETVQVLEMQDTTLQEQDETSYHRFKQELKIRLAEVGIQIK